MMRALIWMGLALVNGLWPMAHGQPANLKFEISDFKSVEKGMKGIGTVVTESFLDRLAWVESRNQALARGRAGERGMYQFRGSTWAEVTRRRRAAGQWTAGFERAWNPEVARVYASAHCAWLEAALRARWGRAPRAEEVYAAYNCGLAGCRRQGLAERAQEIWKRKTE